MKKRIITAIAGAATLSTGLAMVPGIAAADNSTPPPSQDPSHPPMISVQRHATVGKTVPIRIYGCPVDGTSGIELGVRVPGMDEVPNWTFSTRSATKYFTPDRTGKHTVQAICTTADGDLVGGFTYASFIVTPRDGQAAGSGGGSSTGAGLPSTGV